MICTLSDYLPSHVQIVKYSIHDTQTVALLKLYEFLDRLRFEKLHKAADSNNLRNCYPLPFVNRHAASFKELLR